MDSLKHSDLNETKRPFVVSYYLVPGFSLLALSSAIEPLRSANRLLGAQRFKWNIIARTKGPVCAGNGLEIGAEYDMETIPRADLTIVVASLGLENFYDQKLVEHLRWLRRQDHCFGAISNGTAILAEAGVLYGRSTTVHWEMLDTLTERYPDLEISSQLFRIDEKLYTAAGGAASMDMMLEVIADLEGRAIVADIAEQFLHGVIRPASEIQRQDVRSRYRLTDNRLEKAISIMEKRCDAPVKIADIAAQIGVSERQLERLFLRVLGKTPSAFYLTLRLERAHARMISSTDSLAKIAHTTGFSSQAHFSRSYKAWSGSSPLAVRNRLSKDLSA